MHPESHHLLVCPVSPAALLSKVSCNRLRPPPRRRTSGTKTASLLSFNAPSHLDPPGSDSSGLGLSPTFHHPAFACLDRGSFALAPFRWEISVLSSPGVLQNHHLQRPASPPRQSFSAFSVTPSSLPFLGQYFIFS